ncbi:MAG TPA: hypothetical protein VM778_11440, partial [Gemmatimonadota bacterium]|nr:hypothetical protein [Gemmatimonadota bacterium]
MNQVSIFAITPSPDRVRLNKERKGEVAFTVTSTRGPIRARALVVPQGSAKAEWFTLVPPAERFIDGTEQFTVRIAVPEGMEAGEYAFLLKVVSEANPDDEFTDGPQVAFEVPASEPKKPFPWWILFVGGGVLLLAIIGVVIYLVLRDPKLGDACDDGKCGEGLVCSEDDVCVGSFGFEGCTGNDDCAAGLSCAIEEGADTGMCVAALGAECDPEAEEPECGPGLVCEEGLCKGAVEFDGCEEGDCAAGLVCREGTCVDPLRMACTEHADCGPGQSCVSSGGETFCLRDVGQACTEQFECATLACQDGTCVNLPNNASCIANVQCESGICRGGS